MACYKQHFLKMAFRVASPASPELGLQTPCFPLRRCADMPKFQTRKAHMSFSLIWVTIFRKQAVLRIWGQRQRTVHVLHQQSDSKRKYNRHWGNVGDGGREPGPGEYCRLVQKRILCSFHMGQSSSVHASLRVRILPPQAGVSLLQETLLAQLLQQTDLKQALGINFPFSYTIAKTIFWTRFLLGIYWIRSPLLSWHIPCIYLQFQKKIVILGFLSAEVRTLPRMRGKSL